MATMPTTIEDYIPFFKALSHPTRAQIIEFLLSGERCVCEMTGPLDVSQPLVSHHLALLKDAGIVKARDEGARTYYSINRERFDADLDGFVAHVERLRSMPRPALGAGTACAIAGPRGRRKSA
jgi:ArsR family transcriptional regulator